MNGSSPQTQVTGKIDLPSITEVKLKVVSGHAGLHRLSEYTPSLRILILDGSCISSFRDLGSGLKALTTLSVARCNMKHFDGVSGFSNLEELNARDNFVSDPSPCSSVKKLSKLDLSRNRVTDVSYFAFLRSCRKLRELRITENQFSGYKEEIRRLLPQVRILDGEELEECLQPDAPSEEGFPLNSQDLSSEEESSATFSIENIDLAETQLVCDGVDTEDDGENLSPRISESDLNPTQNSSILGEEEDEEQEKAEDPEETIFKSLSALNDSEVPTNENKSTAQETRSGKLSSGRVICGNLAVSLRARNPVKSLSLAMPQRSKDNLEFGEEKNNEKDPQEEEIKSEEGKNCIEEKGDGNYC